MTYWARLRGEFVFAGFDSIETARGYLHLFELTYRFTPFGPELGAERAEVVPK